MNLGLLWADFDKKASLPEKVRRAAEYYQNKYGSYPTLCMVHPSMLEMPGATLYVNGVEVRPMRSVRPNHLWIGFDTKNGGVQ